MSTLNARSQHPAIKSEARRHCISSDARAVLTIVVLFSVAAFIGLAIWGLTR